ncbi:MAG: methionyl-tRNA formyltransferase, partial [Myxococcota bacterium]
MTNTRSLRVVYMGTPDFAVPALDALLESRHEVVAVVTNPDRESGRGKKVRFSPVKERAVAREVEVFQPLKVRGNQGAIDHIASYEPDVIVVAAYGQILPQAVLDSAPMGSLNIHASLLPKYRGAAPIHWAIVRGETESGVTIMQMEAGLDTGPMLLAESVPIAPMDTAQILHDKLSPVGARLLLQALDG